MSNANIVTAIDKLLRRFERGELSATLVDDQLEDYVSALEGLNGESLMAIRDLSARLVLASFSDDEYPGEDPKCVMTEIDRWLGRVPK